MIGQYYKPEDYNAINLPEGDYLAQIIGASEEYAKSSGNPMAVLTLTVQEALSIQFKYRIVEGEYFNKNITRFFDCFKIPRGNFNMHTWIGKTGYVHIAKGEANDRGKQFLEVKTLIVPSVTNQMGKINQTQPVVQRQSPVQQRPNMQTLATIPQQDCNQEDDQFPEDIPW